MSFITKGPAARQPVCFCTPSATSCMHGDQAPLPSLVLTVPLRCPQQPSSDHLNSAGPVPAPGFSLGLGWHFTDVHSTQLFLPPGSFMQYSSNNIFVVVVVVFINNNNNNN